MQKIRVLVVDDDKLVCMSLRTILEADESLEVAGTGHNGVQAIELYNRHLPDILLMDIRMDTMTGLEAAQRILFAHSQAKILFLTTFSDDEYIVGALKMGAKGYILKQNFESIVPSIKAVFAGQRVFGDEIVVKLPNLIQGDRKPAFHHQQLTEKECELLAYIAEGLNNKEISEAMYLSEGTVRNYISILLEKLNMRDRTQLAVFYYKNR